MVDDRLPSGLSVSMYAPWHAKCGIRDYTAQLVEALDSLDGMDAVRIVASPADAVRTGGLSTVAHWSEDDRRYRDLGAAMNESADVAHIQHQYFLFGGVSPLKTHIRAFMNALHKPALMTVHEVAEVGRGPMRALAVRLANRMNFRHKSLRGLIVHTEADRELLIKNACAPGQIHVIRHPVPSAMPMPDPRTARRFWEREYPSLRGRRVLTLFGFLSVKKGHKVALAALGQLPDDIALVFAGDRHPGDNTDYVPTLRADISRLGLKDRVVITGYLPHERVPEVMALTDIALAPFVKTSGSGSLANLLAYGCATVASDIAPHRELLSVCPDLLALFPSGRPDALAAEVAGLLEDPQRRCTLHAIALAYAAKHTYLEMARGTEEIYREIKS